MIDKAKRDDLYAMRDAILQHFRTEPAPNRSAVETLATIGLIVARVVLDEAIATLDEQEARDARMGRSR